MRKCLVRMTLHMHAHRMGRCTNLTASSAWVRRASLNDHQFLVFFTAFFLCWRFLASIWVLWCPGYNACPMDNACGISGSEHACSHTHKTAPHWLSATVRPNRCLHCTESGWKGQMIKNLGSTTSGKPKPDSPTRQTDGKCDRRTNHSRLLKIVWRKREFRNTMTNRYRTKWRSGMLRWFSMSDKNYEPRSKAYSGAGTGTAEGGSVCAKVSSHTKNALACKCKQKGGDLEESWFFWVV